MMIPNQCMEIPSAAGEVKGSHPTAVYNPQNEWLGSSDPSLFMEGK